MNRKQVEDLTEDELYEYAIKTYLKFHPEKKDCEVKEIFLCSWILFELQIDLGLSVNINYYSDDRTKGFVQATKIANNSSKIEAMSTVNFDGNKTAYYATKRAIVMVAAELSLND